VVGDLALSIDSNGKPLPGVAQVAMQQGTYAAHAMFGSTIMKRSFHPSSISTRGVWQ